MTDKKGGCKNCGKPKRDHMKANRGDIYYCHGGGMWQNAAESLPAQPAQEPSFSVHRGIFGETIHLTDSRGNVQSIAVQGGLFEGNCKTCGCIWITRERVRECPICTSVDPIPVEAKEKGIQRLKEALQRSIEQRESLCAQLEESEKLLENALNNSEPVAEPKPTPSTPECEESEYPGVLPAECPKCGEPIWGEGWNPKTGVRYFSHVPQSDSSSISIEHKSVVELAVEHGNLAEYLKQVETELSDTKRALEMACANDTWSSNVYLDSARSERIAAKGQSNGR
jgi:chaperonin cofactor prefoldin